MVDFNKAGSLVREGAKIQADPGSSRRTESSASQRCRRSSSRGEAYQKQQMILSDDTRAQRKRSSCSFSRSFSKR